VDVFLLEKAPMLPKYGLQYINQLLRFIANPNLPFGGEILVAGGDYRQCLPVQPQSNQSETPDLSNKKVIFGRISNMFHLRKIYGSILNRNHLQNTSSNLEMKIFLKINFKKFNYQKT